jgi:PKD repeat protein
MMKTSTLGTIAKWHWDFGDGIFCDSPNFCAMKMTHTFSQVKTYTVTFSATDNKGVTSSVSTIVQPSQKPVDALTATVGILQGIHV